MHHAQHAAHDDAKLYLARYSHKTPIEGGEFFGSCLEILDTEDIS
jgi:hypothetical protein